MFKNLINKIKLFFLRKKEVKKSKKSLLPLHYRIALKEIGVKEIPGPKNTAKILEYHAVAGGFEKDSVPWCSSFVNWCIIKSGQEGTNSAMARSWMTWGKPVNIPKIGDLVCFWRITKNGSFGHIGFYAGEMLDDSNNGFIKVLSGNQSNAVNFKYYPKSRLLGYRRGNW